MTKMIMVCHSLNSNTRMGFVISLCLIKYKSSNQSDPPESPQMLDIYSVVVPWINSFLSYEHLFVSLRFQK